MTTLLPVISISHVEKRRPLRRLPNDHNFGSLVMLACEVGRDKGAFLLSSGVANSLKPEREFFPRRLRVGSQQATLLLLTEHFSDDEDEYGSAKATAQEQIQQRIACCGQKD